MQNMPALTYGDRYDASQIKISAITNETNSWKRWDSLVVALPPSGWRVSWGLRHTCPFPRHAVLLGRWPETAQSWRCIQGNLRPFLQPQFWSTRHPRKHLFLSHFRTKIPQNSEIADVDWQRIWTVKAQHFHLFCLSQLSVFVIKTRLFILLHQFPENS